MLPNNVEVVIVASLQPMYTTKMHQNTPRRKRNSILGKWNAPSPHPPCQLTDMATHLDDGQAHDGDADVHILGSGDLAQL